MHAVAIQRKRKIRKRTKNLATEKLLPGDAVRQSSEILYVKLLS